MVDALTKVLVGLYEVPDRPSNAIEFIKDYLGVPVEVDVEEMKNTIQAQKEEIEALKKQISELTAKNEAKTQ